MKQYHLVYITTNLVNKKFYIGKHSTHNINDGYIGSGKLLKLAIIKYGKENFKRRILCICLSAEEAYDVESFLVTEYIVSRSDTYNMKVGGDGGTLGMPSWNKGKHYSLNLSELQLQKLSERAAGSNNGMYGKHHTEEAKKKMSDAAKGRPGWNKGQHISELQRKKQSQKMKGRTPWNKGLKLK